MKKMTYSSLLSILLLGCGSIDTENQKSSQNDIVQVKLGSYKIDINKEENFILGKGCTSVTIKDLNNNTISSNAIYSNNHFTKNSLTLDKGIYLFNFSKNGARTRGNARGVLYYLSSPKTPNKISFNKKNNISWNSANLYKLELSETTPISISIFNGSIYLYNSLLEYMDYSYIYSRGLKNEIITLDEGIYYVLASSYASLNNCASGSGGYFSINKL